MLLYDGKCFITFGQTLLQQSYRLFVGRHFAFMRRLQCFQLKNKITQNQIDFDIWSIREIYLRLEFASRAILCNRFRVFGFCEEIPVVAPNHRVPYRRTWLDRMISLHCPPVSVRDGQLPKFIETKEKFECKLKVTSVAFEFLAPQPLTVTFFLHLFHCLFAFVQFARQSLHCFLFNGQIDTHATQRTQQMRFFFVRRRIDLLWYGRCLWCGRCWRCWFNCIRLCANIRRVGGVDITVWGFRLCSRRVLIDNIVIIVWCTHLLMRFDFLI